MRESMCERQGREMGGGVYGFGITTCSLGQRIFGQVIKIAGSGDM